MAETVDLTEQRCGWLQVHAGHDWESGGGVDHRSRPLPVRRYRCDGSDGSGFGEFGIVPERCSDDRPHGRHRYGRSATADCPGKAAGEPRLVFEGDRDVTLILAALDLACQVRPEPLPAAERAAVWELLRRQPAVQGSDGVYRPLRGEGR